MAMFRGEQHLIHSNQIKCQENFIQLCKQKWGKDYTNYHQNV